MTVLKMFSNKGLFINDAITGGGEGGGMSQNTTNDDMMTKDGVLDCG